MSERGRSSYDVIGDIHGHAGALDALLGRLGYVRRGRGFRAPAGRQAVFVGDLIDRGPEQREVLHVVRAMVESGDARCVLGNHEVNAIAYATEAPAGGDCLRPNRGADERCARNRAQHAAFLAAVGEGSAEHRGWVDWFRKLPLALDLGGIRVVHASWDEASIERVAGCYWDRQGRMSDTFLYGSYEPRNALKTARKRLTCGLEWRLPAGAFIVDKEGQRHYECRIAGWRHDAERLRDVALVPAGQAQQMPDQPLPRGVLRAIEGAPVFVGHYWFVGHPAIETPKLAVLDWSVARGGRLVAYRWDGEETLSNDKLVWVTAN